VRDAALIALGWASGARRAEIAALWIDEARSSDPNTVRLLLHGKGDKNRSIDLSQGAAWALTDWLKLRGKSEGFVFCMILKSGRIVLDHGLSTQALADVLHKRRLQAGVAELTWHDFRRSFAGNLLNANVDLATVQKLMGHASPITTSAYDRRGEEVQRAALGHLHVSYTQRALLPPRRVKK
jgi:site-specific recombinase XerD